MFIFVFVQRGWREFSQISLNVTSISTISLVFQFLNLFPRFSVAVHQFDDDFRIVASGYSYFQYFSDFFSFFQILTNFPQISANFKQKLKMSNLTRVKQLFYFTHHVGNNDFALSPCRRKNFTWVEKRPLKKWWNFPP